MTIKMSRFVFLRIFDNFLFLSKDLAHSDPFIISVNLNAVIHM